MTTGDPVEVETRCTNCSDRIRTFLRPGEPRPTLCGRFACRVTAWTDAEWEGRTHMARARAHAGQPLDDVDRQALRRHDAGHIATPPWIDALLLAVAVFVLGYALTRL